MSRLDPHRSGNGLVVWENVDMVPPEFPSSDRVARLAAVRHELQGAALVLSNPSNIRWLSGFGGSTAWIVVTPGRAVFVTDGRYADRAAADLDAGGLDQAGFELVVGRSHLELVAAVVAAAGQMTVVRAEGGHLTHEQWMELAADLPLQPAARQVEGLRRTKDTGEIARIRWAAGIADVALGEVAQALGDGRTETDVRDALEIVMRGEGADGPSYATIVASGPRFAARPHHQPTRRVIEEGDTVIVDVGALVDGYHSDMTRTFVVGEPTDQQREIYELVRVAQAAGLATVAAGVAGRDVDEACRAVFREAGYADWFVHGTGHGVGLDIHEQPFAASTSTAVLVAGDVVTVEPGLYRDGFGGVRIEDLVSVTATGCDVLTKLPKDAPCLPSPPTI